MAQVYLIEDGYGIRGLEPPGLLTYPAEIRRQFWGWVAEAGLKAKDRDSAKGLDKDGKPLRPISAATRKHRRSAMTPSGRGDPSAPPLEPGWQKSRVRSLLTAKAFEDHAEFWWKFDPHIGDSFARILEGQRAMGRDVFGLSPAGLKRVQAEAWKKWEAWKKGEPVALTKEPRLQPVKVPQVGSKDLRFAVGGAGFTDTIKAGQHSGFMTIEKWPEYFRDPAGPAARSGSQPAGGQSDQRTAVQPAAGAYLGDDQADERRTGESGQAAEAEGAEAADSDPESRHEARAEARTVQPAAVRPGRSVGRSVSPGQSAVRRAESVDYRRLSCLPGSERRHDGSRRIQGTSDRAEPGWVDLPDPHGHAAGSQSSRAGERRGRQRLRRGLRHSI